MKVVVKIGGRALEDKSLLQKCARAVADLSKQHDVAVVHGGGAEITRTMALRKLGAAEDVARAVLMLASDEISGHITGQVVTVAGGMEGRVLHDH